MKKRAKKQNFRPHDAVLWARLCFIIRVETGWANEPISFQKIRNLCRDVALEELDMGLQELIRSRRILCSREWTQDGRMIEIFTNNE